MIVAFEPLDELETLFTETTWVEEQDDADSIVDCSHSFCESLFSFVGFLGIALDVDLFVELSFPKFLILMDVLTSNVE